MRIVCPNCGQPADKDANAVNRAQREGYLIYCSRKCSGLGRRVSVTKAEKVAAKRLYDKQYRAERLAEIKRRKQEYFRRTYDPAKAAIDRKKRAAAHAEYCRRPEYREWKREYDRQYRARKQFGEFSEGAILLDKLRQLLRRNENVSAANG